jgi:hypothetical protein
MSCGCKKRNQPVPQPVPPPAPVNIRITENQINQAQPNLTPEQTDLLNQIADRAKNLNP